MQHVRTQSRRELYSEATRAALLDEATRLFATRGYAGTSLEDVAVASQVTRGAGTVLIDPVACPGLSGLDAALAGTEAVLHAASQDLPCLAEVGFRPQQLFDTELAGRLLGYPPAMAGTLFIPRAVVSAITLAITGSILIKLFDTRYLVTAGLVMTAVGGTHACAVVQSPPGRADTALGSAWPVSPRSCPRSPWARSPAWASPRGRAPSPSRSPTNVPARA